MELPKWLEDKRDELWAKDAPSGSYSIAAREGFNACAELLLNEDQWEDGYEKGLNDGAYKLKQENQDYRAALEKVRDSTIPALAVGTPFIAEEVLVKYPKGE